MKSITFITVNSI